jgi:hypothetical protein
MPPAFNLSQDQTLQFDLDLLFGIEVNFITEFHFLFPRAFKVMRPGSYKFAFAFLYSAWHSPSNAHAYRLYVVKELAFRRHRSYSAKTTILTCFIKPCQPVGLCAFLSFYPVACLRPGLCLISAAIDCSTVFSFGASRSPSFVWPAPCRPCAKA